MASPTEALTAPHVSCDVCGRRLLRGEHAAVFLDGPDRRTVCELCANRAIHGGWLREADAHSSAIMPARRRGPRTLLGRLRARRERDWPMSPMSPHIPSELPHAPEQPDAGESAALAPSEGAPLPASEGAPLPASEGAPSAAPEPGVAHALELFNSSDQPARIAGIARALGAPCVTVQAAGDAGGRVTIVVAWELCWYRYQLDLAAPAESLALVDRGTELDELAPHERAGGVLADELGRLSATLA